MGRWVDGWQIIFNNNLHYLMGRWVDGWQIIFKDRSLLYKSLNFKMNYQKYEEQKLNSTLCLKIPLGGLYER